MLQIGHLITEMRKCTPMTEISNSDKKLSVAKVPHGRMSKITSIYFSIN